ncbi:Bud-site selection protein [Phlegmacium glaucopus]|nr:Bud-site selection protein [Phlegmacium glaucopus]
MDNDIQRGIKRKRYEPPQEELSIRIKGKLHHEMKEVHKATKKAKIFETQKVVKKLKDLGKKGDTTSQAVGEHEAELTCLKGTDHDSIGNTALKTKLLKDRTLRENEEIITAMNKELEGSLVVLAEPGTTVAKIQSRLLSSKILGIQVAASLEALKVLLNPALKQNEPESNAPVPSDKGVERPSKLRKETSNVTAKVQTRPDNTDHDANVNMDDAGWESGSIDEDRVENLTDDGWESGEISPKEDESSESEDDELKVKPKSKLGKPAKSSSSINESTFLPSLSVGFIRGGSDDSDWSETEGKSTDLEPKKNRRGQRARRAIWEKKFGRNANHKKKEEEVTAQARKISGHTSKITGSNGPKLPGPSSARGSARYSKDKKFSQIHQPVDAGWGTRTVGVSTPSIVTPAGMDRPLHPSWEAKRRLKEKQSVGIVPSQGKKIKFS